MTVSKVCQYWGAHDQVARRASDKHLCPCALTYWPCHYVAGQKGSDVSAREATVKLIAVTQQHKALQDLLASLGARGGTPKSARRPGCSGKVLGRNMIVRGALAELTNAQSSHHHHSSP